MQRSVLYSMESTAFWTIRPVCTHVDEEHRACGTFLPKVEEP